jgi:pilus assembly protein CpaF
MKCLCDEIDPAERLAIIEDTPELWLRQPNVVRLVTRGEDVHGEGEVTLRDLFRSALRLRPDRILVGEVRGPEAFDLVQALGSGHSGSVCTIHADSPALALTRVQSLALGAGIPVPSSVLREQISLTFHYVVQINRQTDGARRVSSVFRVEPFGGEAWALHPVFLRREGEPLSWVSQDPWLEGVGAEILSREAPSLVERVRAR